MRSRTAPGKPRVASRRWKRIAMAFGLGVVALFLAIQLVPYGHQHANPALVAEPAWDRPDTRALAERACFDCHSNRTEWPWYSHVAPASWLVQRHVEEGREVLNFSDWGGSEDDELAESVLEGEMPPGSYLLLHPEARLTVAERDALARGLVATARGSYRPALEGAGRMDEDDD